MLSLSVALCALCRPGPLTRRRSNCLTVSNAQNFWSFNGGARLRAGDLRSLGSDERNSPTGEGPFRAERPGGSESKSRQLKVIIGKYSQIKPPGFSALALRVPLRPSCSKNFSLQPSAFSLAAQAPIVSNGRLWTLIVATCSRSRIRSKTYSAWPASPVESPQPYSALFSVIQCCSALFFIFVAQLGKLPYRRLAVGPHA